MRRYFNDEVGFGIIDMVDLLNIAFGECAIAESRERDRAARERALKENAAREKNVRTARRAKSSECRCNEQCKKSNSYSDSPKMTDFIDRIIAQDTAVVIFWKDGTKTSARCSADEPFDYEKGIAIATLKYVFGNKCYEDIQLLMNEFPHTKTEKRLALEAEENKAKLLVTDPKNDNLVTDDKKPEKKSAPKKSTKNVNVDKKDEK